MGRGGGEGPEEIIASMGRGLGERRGFPGPSIHL